MGRTSFSRSGCPKLGVETTFVDTTDYEQHERAIRPNTRMLYLESPTNPALRVVDLKAARGLARKHGLISMIDSTFGTPINQHPAEYGIDLIMHSGTKYLAGHSDLICGVVAGRDELIEKILATRTTLRQLHGSARLLDAGARVEDAGRAGGAAERECYACGANSWSSTPRCAASTIRS